MRKMKAGRQKQKFVGLVTICDRFEVLLGMKIHRHDYVKPFTSRVPQCKTQKSHPRPVQPPGLALVSNKFRLG